MDTDIKVTINLNKLVEERIKKMGAYRDFAEKSVMGTLVSTSDIDEIAIKSRSYINLNDTYDAIDKLICEHLGIRESNIKDMVFGERRNGN
mgnify:FL=1|tara:strand:- start:162 stop:434 length:273 start_codon:yes stop_codon:yes gene_type:complete